MKTEDEENYQNSQNCWICDQIIFNNKDKVRDHCHITGKFRAAAHKECNSKLRIPRKMPIIFHNLEGYDGHLIFRELNNFKDIDIQVIPKTDKRYMRIIVNNNIIFLGSLQFCKASLDTLAVNLQDSDFKNLLSEFAEDKLKLLRKKDSHPYEWVDSYKKFLYSRLPPKESFYSSIDNGKRGKRDGHVSYRQYLHLKFVWKEFGFKNFRDFHNHYFKKDELLLVDLFENFISTCLKYNLDPCHYFSAPSLSWDAMLKMTKVELERISNPYMRVFIERCMRRGASYAKKIFSKANNEYCPDYDKNKPKVYINYHDMNNLYGNAMSQYLPYGGFKWVEVNNETVNRILNKSDNTLHGYFLEVDLDYPEELHDIHNDYSMAPEKIKKMKCYLDVLLKY